MKAIKYIILSIFWCLLNHQFIFAQYAEHILESNKPSLVSIWAYEDASYNYITGAYSFDTLVFWGSGFIISKEGKVGTCYHVVSQLDSIIIKTSDGSFFPSTTISVDTVNDLVLLKIQCDEDKIFPFVKMGNSDDLKTGELIFTIGNPLGFEYSISQGIISGIRDNAKEYLDGKEVMFDRVIQTDAAVSPGNSGGAFFNSKGEVIGITSYYYLSLGNLNFGVAINCFKKLAEQNNTEPMMPPVKSNIDKEEKIVYYLEIAKSLKEKIREYDIMNDSLNKNLHPRPSPTLDDTLSSSKTINQDSLDNVYLTKVEYFYNKCLNLDSTYFDTYDDLIDYYIKIKKPMKAEEIYKNAQEIFRDDARLQYLSNSLELYYLRYKDFNKIKKLYGIVEGNKEINPDVFYKLGSMYDNIGDSINALKHYHLAIKKDSKYYKAYFQIGKYYFNLELYKKAKKYFESAYESLLMPDRTREDDRNIFREDTYSDFDLHYYLGMILIKEGDKMAALINYLKLYPANLDESEKSLKLYKKIVN